ncbi:MAG TPA: glycosyltransferase family 4 protein, partial [Flavisolibacter sp.]|nr:glycosyltransferase family 4 protein [Flavisolibacter sp.]
QSTAVFKEAAIIREIITTVKALPCEYIYTFTIKPNLYTTLTSALTQKKVIMTVNGLGNVFSGESMVGKISLRLFKGAFKRAYGIVFQNRDDYAFFRDKINLDLSKVLFVRGSGVNTADFPLSKKALPAGGELAFLMACRLLKEKGVYQFIEAARRIKKEFSGVQFRLLGMEALNPSAIRIADLEKFSTEGSIQLLPQTDDVNGLLESTDVLVLPSFYNEGVPRILLEGLSKGLPIITTDSVGCRETVVDNSNGYLIEPRSTDALENALRRMIALPVAERANMQLQSRQLAASEFDESKVVESYLAIIKGPGTTAEKQPRQAVGAKQMS